MTCTSSGIFVLILGCSYDLGRLSGSRGGYFTTGLPIRDEPARRTKASAHGVAGRLERAFRNFLETFPMFAAAVLSAHAAGRHSSRSILAAQLYFWGRVAYVPTLVFCIPLVRSLVWNVASIGMLLVWSMLLFP